MVMIKVHFQASLAKLCTQMNAIRPTTSTINIVQYFFMVHTNMYKIPAADLKRKQLFDGDWCYTL